MLGAVIIVTALCRSVSFCYQNMKACSFAGAKSQRLSLVGFFPVFLAETRKTGAGGNKRTKKEKSSLCVLQGGLFINLLYSAWAYPVCGGSEDDGDEVFWPRCLLPQVLSLPWAPSFQAWERALLPSFQASAP